MYLTDILMYVEKGDDILVDLYSGKAKRGVFLDSDDISIILGHLEGSDYFEIIIPVMEIETIALVSKIKTNKPAKVSKRKTKE